MSMPHDAVSAGLALASILTILSIFVFLGHGIWKSSHDVRNRVEREKAEAVTAAIENLKKNGIPPENQLRSGYTQPLAEYLEELGNKGYEREVSHY